MLPQVRGSSGLKANQAPRHRPAKQGMPPRGYQTTCHHQQAHKYVSFRLSPTGQGVMDVGWTGQCQSQVGSCKGAVESQQATTQWCGLTEALHGGPHNVVLGNGI
jgi:hypothetical protein